MVWLHLHTNDAVASPSEKTCKSCARMLPMLNYSLNKTMVDNRLSKCKDCVNRAQNLNRPSRKSTRVEEPAKRQRLDATVPGEHLYIMAFSFDPAGAPKSSRAGKFNASHHAGVSEFPWAGSPRGPSARHTRANSEHRGTRARVVPHAVAQHLDRGGLCNASAYYKWQLSWFSSAATWVIRGLLLYGLLRRGRA
jgi:hypothetical protein